VRAAKGAEPRELTDLELVEVWAGRTSASLHLPSRAANVRPGELVRIEGQPGLWRIERWMLEAMVVKLQLVQVPGSAAAPMDASSGRPLGERDLRQGPTILRLIELPSDGETASDRPRLLVAAAGELPGWRRAALMMSLDRGASWQELGGTAAPAVIGRAQTALPPAGSALLDNRHAVIVQLGHEEMWLQSATDPALANGANLALIGDELIQFGAAEPIGDNRFRLSRLLRGRLGTEWAALAHQPDDDFVLLDSATLLPVEVPVTAVGGEMRVSATGLGDALEGVGASRPVSGEALRPPSPVHLRASTTSGGVEIGWTRRSRTGWAWTDGSGASLAEEAERYELVISGAAFRRAIAVATPGYLYSQAEQAADAASGPVVIEVVQLGTRARSRPARIASTI
jgi:hypothetical protein